MWENPHLVTKASWKKLVSSWTLPWADSSLEGLCMCQVLVTEKTHAWWWSLRSRNQGRGLVCLPLHFSVLQPYGRQDLQNAQGTCTSGAQSPRTQRGHDPTERWSSSWGMSHRVEYLPAASWGGIWDGLVAFARHRACERLPSLSLKKSKITRRY